MDNFDDDLKKMKAVEKEWKNKLANCPRKGRNNFGLFYCVFEKEIQGDCHDLFLYQKFAIFKAIYLKLIHEVNKGNYITFSVEPFGLPLPLSVGALGVALGPSVDVGATTSVAFGPARPAVCVDVSAAAGPESGLELGPTAGLELGPAVKLVPDAGWTGSGIGSEEGWKVGSVEGWIGVGGQGQGLRHFLGPDVLVLIQH
ncbi:hypothetical protein H5410_019770 [Solanum commersonii]|uniref:Uncharacterized protein n=1 Tax=Solanum commersonii TaxID=4109 RepID=A0A9J5Z6I7_SOLCO|nr:hypothetical protein H5410_019770 [Solanum commersonii]